MLRNFVYAASRGLGAKAVEMIEWNAAFADRVTFFDGLGHIRFGDVFGNEYISGFCLARNGATGEFYGLGGSQYNYRRKIKTAGE